MAKKLRDYDEIDRIIDFFQKNKVSVIKLNSQIDQLKFIQETQYSGYITLENDGNYLCIYNKKPRVQETYSDYKQLEKILKQKS